MKIPTVSLDPVAELIDRHHQSKTEHPRPHLGASTLGHHCERWLWLSFRWAARESFDGRTLRLFRRGQNEEAVIIDDLRAIGIKIDDQQARVDFGAHVSGSLDGIIESGVPQAPKKRHVAEFKTHSKKSFDDLVSNGVQKSKPMHYAQMQVYMLGTGIDRALYVAVCKDDDRLHTERVRLDKKAAEALVEKGKRIALSDRMPPPISTDPTWYQCRWCAAHDLCHGSKVVQHVSCRTCAHVTPLEDSTWRCERYQADDIPAEFQREGCDAHVFNPDLVPWVLLGTSTDTVAVWVIDGHEVRNGHPSEGAYTSREILINLDAVKCADEVVEKVRKKFDARVTG